jgi:hypothetical protein
MTAPTTLWLRRLVSPGRPQAPDRGGVRPLLDHVRLRNMSAAGVSQRSQARLPNTIGLSRRGESLAGGSRE